MNARMNRAGFYENEAFNKYVMTDLNGKRKKRGVAAQNVCKSLKWRAEKLEVITRGWGWGKERFDVYRPTGCKDAI